MQLSQSLTVVVVAYDARRGAVVRAGQYVELHHQLVPSVCRHKHQTRHKAVKSMV